ncbi:MAG: NADH dehydrogenase FAD-containing subunit [Candidatus Carbobacillus sp.]|nr:NADH dehydrogenase FAD-containing subunit [Candidatus Carbobacillus sp.]
MIIEFKKLLKNKLTYISFGIMILIVIGNTWMGTRLFYEDYAVSKRIFANFPDSLALVAPHRYWAISYGTFFAALYYFIFPLLIALPIVDTIYKERSSGNQRYQILRMSRFSYYLNKFLFTFIVSFLFFVLPLLLDMFLFNLITGKWDYSDYARAYHKLVNGTAVLGDSTSYGEKRELFSPLMEISPYLYFLAYLIIGGLYAGLYTAFGLASSLYMKNRYLILFTPFSLYIGYWIIFSLLGFQAWDPFNFLAATEPVTSMSYPPFIVVFTLLMAVTLILYIAGVRKQADLFD